MYILIPKSICNNFDGYNELISIYNQLNESNEGELLLDFKETMCFEANLSAVLGAICSLVEEDRKKRVINLNPTIIDVFRRNLFLSDFDENLEPEDNGTIITYRKFSPYKDIEFMEYIKNELLSKPDFPKHSRLLGKKINESIFELFENARTHGHSKTIFTCGQLYTGITPKRLDMTIVDLGNTIKYNVNEYLGKEMAGHEAIAWAMKYGNTTKTGDISGGLGLDLIFEFIKLNKGKIQIISSDGFWEYRREEVETRVFDRPFPGTIANIEFNLEDEEYYVLKEEISLTNIF